MDRVSQTPIRRSCSDLRQLSRIVGLSNSEGALATSATMLSRIFGEDLTRLRSATFLAINHARVALLFVGSG